MKDKHHIIISIDAQKAFEKMQHPLIIILNRASIEGMYLNIIKVTHDKTSQHHTLYLLPLDHGV